MATQLSIVSGQYSSAGQKPLNQDALGLQVPQSPLLSTKGIAAVIADGISSSNVSQEASQAMVQGFLHDYYCTAESWSVKKSATQVMQALNAWLLSQTQKSEFRFEPDKGYVCTFSALILKSTSVHWCHVGDSRIYLLRGGQLRQLSDDHRLFESPQNSYLSRAMGVSESLEIDYGSLELQTDDLLMLVTDGIYEFVSHEHFIALGQALEQDLNHAARHIAELALANGSDDNLSIMLIAVKSLAAFSLKEKLQELTHLPFAPLLNARQHFETYQILKTIHHSSRSHVYLANDTLPGHASRAVVIKIPSIDQRDDPAYLERFLQEEWIAKRIDNPHVLKSYATEHQRGFLYTVFEYIEGQTLSQWMRDNPRPSLETVRNIVEPLATGLGAFHRLEMLHQDLRPDNIMIDNYGIVKIIDFGSTRVAGLEEIASPYERLDLLGTAQYSAPEYFIGETASHRSDLFSLAVITYQLLSGDLPYGADVARARSKKAQHQLRYHSILSDDRDIPAWLDDTLKRALQPNPDKRHAELSEFIYELRHPSQAFLRKNKAPLLERNPLAFWQSLCVLLVLVILYLLY